MACTNTTRSLKAGLGGTQLLKRFNLSLALAAFRQTARDSLYPRDPQRILKHLLRQASQETYQRKNQPTAMIPVRKTNTSLDHPPSNPPTANNAPSPAILKPNKKEGTALQGTQFGDMMIVQLRQKNLIRWMPG